MKNERNAQDVTVNVSGPRSIAYVGISGVKTWESGWATCLTTNPARVVHLKVNMSLMLRL